MKAYPVHAGNFKLDGGAMFGVVPKLIWNSLNPADENNMCNWAMRCLLIEDGNRLILIDNGMGNKQDSRFFSHYHLNGDDTLEKSVNKAGFGFDEITDVFLTHLHFDHCGGSIKSNKDKTGYETAFKNATYWSNMEHWKWATEPNPRERASFLKENIIPIQESGQLRFINDGDDLIPGFKVVYVHGHTGAMMIPFIKIHNKTLVFMADLLPSSGHIPLPYTMAYDTRPLITFEEKKKILQEASLEDYILFLEHDLENECCTVVSTEKGVRLKEKFPLHSVFP